MEILIRENATVNSTMSISKDYKQFIESNRGKWLPVETDYLFCNQYNTADFRVMDSYVSAVRDDARIGKGKCKYCGRLVSEGETCTKHKECEQYGIEWFTAKNCFFIKHPNGIPAVKPFPFKNGYCSNELPKFGSFTLEHLTGSLNYYRLSNRNESYSFLYADGIFYMLNSSPCKKLGIKAKSFPSDKLREYLENELKRYHHHTTL
jgi:hypothetical protein